MLSRKKRKAIKNRQQLLEYLNNLRDISKQLNILNIRLFKNKIQRRELAIEKIKIQDYISEVEKLWIEDSNSIAKYKDKCKELNWKIDRLSLKSIINTIVLKNK